MKERLLKPPESPYPIRLCLEAPVRWYHRLWCSLFGHYQCGFHWEDHSDTCCRCREVPK